MRPGRRHHRRRPDGPRARARRCEQAGVGVRLLGHATRTDQRPGAGLVLIADAGRRHRRVAARPRPRTEAVGASTRSCSTSPACWTGSRSTPLPTPALASAPSTRSNRSPIRRPHPSGSGGAFAGLEGDDRARRPPASGSPRALGMRAVRLAPGAKPAYHAGAVFASNYVVVLAAVAESLAREAGVPPPRRRDALPPAHAGHGRQPRARAGGGADRADPPGRRGDRPAPPRRAGAGDRRALSRARPGRPATRAGGGARARRRPTAVERALADERLSETFRPAP